MGTMKIANRPPRAPRTTAAERTQLLTAFARSGLSVAAFARQHALNYTTFCGWRQRQGKADSVPTFVEIELPVAPEPAELVVEWGAQARLRIRGLGQIPLAVRLLHDLNAATPC
jgi:transposase-like protein